MKTFRYLAPLALAFAATDLASQQTRIWTSSDDEDRPRIGVSTGPSGKRDTLGLLVTSVTRGGPAEKAGIEEGDRLVSVNGVNLRISTLDIDDYEMTGVGTRRLMRELGKVKAGDRVSMRVYREGQTRDVSVTTVSSEDLQPQRAAVTASTVRRDMEDRAALGIGLGASGSRRDTLGVLVSSVTDDGPADKARIEEGDRIAAINGVDLRVPGADAGDFSVASSRMRRLTRELDKVKAGDEVELRLIRSGQSRTLRVKTVAAKDLPRSAGISIGGDGFYFNAPGGASFSFPRGALVRPRGEGQNFFEFDDSGLGGVRSFAIPRGDGMRMFEFGGNERGALRMLAPERRAEVEQRLDELRGRLDRGRVIIRPRVQHEDDDDFEARSEGLEMKRQALEERSREEDKLSKKSEALSKKAEPKRKVTLGIAM